MTIIREYRVVLPLSVDEYQIGQLYSVAEASKQETGGGEGVEIIKNEPFSNKPLYDGSFSSGQYTYKVYHLKSKVPKFLQSILHQDEDAYDIHEEAWNAYPYCKTILSNPNYMKDNFFVKIETIHLNDRGITENAHKLSPSELRQRRVVHIDIAKDEHLAHSDILPQTSPVLFKSQKTGRGPLHGDWKNSCHPVMCAYKLVTVYFKWFGVQHLVETFGHKQYPRLFSKFHREVFCWMDQWYGLTIEDIREIEERARIELEETRKTGEVRGMTA